MQGARPTQKYRPRPRMFDPKGVITIITIVTITTIITIVTIITSITVYSVWMMFALNVVVGAMTALL